jgi:polyisoprenoid-binding protein YceI
MNAFVAAATAIAIGNAASGAQPRDTVRVEIGHGSQVWIEGSSNVVDWRCKATAFDARVEFEPSADGDRNIGSALRTIRVSVAVRDLKCGNGRMERDLYAALRATDPERPAYILGRFDVIVDSSGGADLATRGPLTVAGVERTVNVPVTTVRETDGAIRARGAVSMLMTDFGIKPPVGLFGLIRSRNEITVKFDLIVPARTIVLR